MLHYMKYNNIIINNLPQLLLTIEDFVELSWGSMSHKVGCYADLWKEKYPNLKSKKLKNIIINMALYRLSLCGSNSNLYITCLKKGSQL